MSCSKTSRVRTAPDLSVITITLSASQISRKDIVVIDWISFSGVCGATDENWYVSIDDGTTEMYRVGQAAAATTRDTLFVQFHTGFPLWTPVASGFSVSNGPPAPTINFSLSGPTVAAGSFFAVGYHCEAATQRAGE
jgi:hypothetical protein